MKRLVCLVLVLLLAIPAFAWEGRPKSGGPVKEVIESTWEGEIDLDMLHKIQRDIKWAKDEKAKTLKVLLMSSGGPVITSLESARVIRDASDGGLVIEIHATGMCASGCTLVLAAGTPGKRYISKTALFLLHAVQTGGGLSRLRRVESTRLNQRVSTTESSMPFSRLCEIATFASQDVPLTKSRSGCRVGTRQ